MTGERDHDDDELEQAIRDGLREQARRASTRDALSALRDDWMRYAGPASEGESCARCGEALPRDTGYLHCAACLATRGIDEGALRRACAGAFERTWPLGERRLDGRRWVHTLVAFWRNHVDPMEVKAVPYRTETLASAFRFVRRHLVRSRVEEVWSAPEEARDVRDPAMVVRAGGETLAVGVGTLPRIARDEADAPFGGAVASFDAFLGLAGERSGWLVLEKQSRRARRDAPPEERVVTTPRGHEVRQLRCPQEDRRWLIPDEPP